ETKEAPVAPAQGGSAQPLNKSTPEETEKEKTSSLVPAGKEAATNSPAGEGLTGTGAPAIEPYSRRGAAVPAKGEASNAIAGPVGQSPAAKDKPSPADPATSGNSDSSTQVPAVKASGKESDGKAPVTAGETDVKKSSETAGAAVSSAAAPTSPGTVRMKAPQAATVAKSGPQLTDEVSRVRGVVTSDSSPASESVQPASASPFSAGRVEPATAPEGSSEKETDSPADSAVVAEEPVVTAVAAAGNGLEIATNAPVESFSYSTKSAPARLIIYLLGFSKNKSGKDTVPLGVMGIAGARVDALHGKVRIVLDADQETFPRFRVEAGEKGLKVSLAEAAQSGGTPAMPVSRERVPPPGEKSTPVPSATQDGATAPEPQAPSAGGTPPARGEAVGSAKEFFRFTVQFDTAKADLIPRYYGMLRQAIDFMKANPGTVAEIRGHTDSLGKAPYNMRLSQKRAAAVRKYLMKKADIDASRIVVRGYGFYFPVADNRTAAGRQKNRRTEVTIIIRQGKAAAASAVAGAR
ncbi:MAG TPA: OmpA family protein, partial [Geobacteraceae bacterium]